MKKVSIIVLVGIIAYAFLFWNSIRKVDNFCNSIDATTKMRELQQLADNVGVELRGPRMISNSSGEYVYAVAASGFTVGEYACRIHAESMSGTVSRKRLGY